MEVRTLTADDAAAFQELRLLALQECPAAFSSSYEEEKDRPIALVGGRLTPTADGAVFGGFFEDRLIGIVGVQRVGGIKQRHKAFVWGVYIAVAFRMKGFGRKLLQAAVDHAEAMPGVLKVDLGVNAANHASMALYSSLGFTAFGTERGFLLIDGVLHDEVHMSRRVERN